MNIELVLAHTKGAVRSWTIWANGVVLSLVLAAPLLQDFLPTIKPFLNETGFERLTMLVLVLNLVLRIKTNKPLSAK